jgi:preprotein translocase subunit SecE
MGELSVLEVMVLIIIGAMLVVLWAIDKLLSSNFDRNER